MSTDKKRLHTIYAKFLFEGKEYTARVVDMDTLEHVEWKETVIYEPTQQVLEALEAEMFALDDEAFDKKMIESVKKYALNGWNLSEKQSAQFQKIAQRYLKGRKFVTVKSLDEAADIAAGALDPNQIPF